MGNWYSTKVGVALPQGIDYQQRPTTEGPSQFIIAKGKKGTYKDMGSYKQRIQIYEARSEVGGQSSH